MYPCCPGRAEPRLAWLAWMGWTHFFPASLAPACPQPALFCPSLRKNPAERMSYLELMVSVGGTLWERAASVHSGGQLLWLDWDSLLGTPITHSLMGTLAPSSPLHARPCGGRQRARGGRWTIFFGGIREGFAGELGLEG